MREVDRRKMLSSAAVWSVAAAGGLLGVATPGLARPRRYDPDAEDAGALGDNPYEDPFYGPDRLQRRAPADPFYDPDATPVYRPRVAAPDDGALPGASGRVYDYRRVYAAVGSEPFPIPAFRYAATPATFLRQSVAYGGRESPGTIVIDPRAHLLYHVEDGGSAMRYGVGVGRQGFGWSGAATINSKQEWPDWYPPKEMIARQPELARQMSELQSGIGMHGGPRNPLGARAMYLWQGNKDTLFRIHGTTEPWTIGKSVSSGCIRMINQDVIDLYARVEVGSRVIVL